MPWLHSCLPTPPIPSHPIPLLPSREPGPRQQQHPAAAPGKGRGPAGGTEPLRATRCPGTALPGATGRGDSVRRKSRRVMQGCALEGTARVGEQTDGKTDRAPLPAAVPAPPLPPRAPVAARGPGCIYRPCPARRAVPPPPPPAPPAPLAPPAAASVAAAPPCPADRQPRYRQGAPGLGRELRYQQRAAVSVESPGTVREPRHPPQARPPLPGPGGGGSALTSRSGRAGEPRPASPVSRSFQQRGEKGMCARACPRTQLPPWERLSRGWRQR